MKTKLYVVAIIAACGAAVFSFIHYGKFQTLKKDKVEVIAASNKVMAEAEAAKANNKKGKESNTTSREKLELLTQSISSLKSAGSSLANNLTKLNDDLKAQEEESVQTNQALAEVNTILAGLGDGVTIDTLQDKIQQIDTDKKAKQAKLDELEVLLGGADKGLAGNRAELDRLAKRTIERNSRIARNSMEAVVTAVNQDWGFLVIGAGSNSGFTPQTGLLVERDGRNIGRVRPSSIEATQTIAEIDLASLASGVRLQPGDRVILAKPATN